MNLLNSIGIEKITPKKNAVIIAYDKCGEARVSAECKDGDMKYFLVCRAREILGLINGRG